MTVRKVPEPTPEQIEQIMLRLLGVTTATEQRTLFRIGKKAGVFWTHRGCPSKGVSMLTNENCLWCGAPRPAPKTPKS